MMKILREFLFIGLVALMIFGGMGQFNDADLIAKIAEGPTELILPEQPSQPQEQPQQEVVLTTLDGEQVMSIVDVLPEGTEAAFVVFFTSDCPYCGILMEALEVQDVIPVVGASFREDDETAIRAKIAELGITFPIVLGHPVDMMPQFPSYEGVPYTMVIEYTPEGWNIMWAATGIPSLADYPTHQEQVDFLAGEFSNLATQAIQSLKESINA